VLDTETIYGRVMVMQSCARQLDITMRSLKKDQRGYTYYLAQFACHHIKSTYHHDKKTT